MPPRLETFKAQIACLGITPALNASGFIMQRYTAPKKWLVFVAILAALSSCSKRESAPVTAHDKPIAPAYFKTHWKDESQFIVEAITMDIAEMICFAKSKILPEERQFSVNAAEMAGTAFRAPVYRVEVNLPEVVAPVTTDIEVIRPIWEPELYQPLALAVLKALGLPRGSQASPDRTNL